MLEILKCINTIEFSQHKNFIMFFLFFLVIFSNFLTVPVVKEKIKVKLALAIPTGAPIILDTPQLKFYLYNQKL